MKNSLGTKEGGTPFLKIIPIQKTGYWGTLDFLLFPLKTSMVHVSMREHPKHKYLFGSMTVYMSLCAIMCAGVNKGLIGQWFIKIRLEVVA